MSLVHTCVKKSEAHFGSLSLFRRTTRTWSLHTETRGMYKGRKEIKPTPNATETSGGTDGGPNVVRNGPSLSDDEFLGLENVSDCKNLNRKCWSPEIRLLRKT